ncbi:MAG: GIY-YIG nuclease family protein [Bacilli bacterium]|nr:GIY-YIG nuclease family protein [Bacilli bacterium]MBR1582004.1 GIY-YIG nuclease family protein [Bacilli bacterium]
MKTTIKLFLMDGTATGRIKCSFSSGWNGIGYKIPKSDLDKCDNITFLKQAGVYFLFGCDEEDSEFVYVGQGNKRQNGQGVLSRIKEAHDSVPLWNACVVFVSSGEDIGPTELNYLENRFTNMASVSGRYLVKNNKNPSSSQLSEEDEADMSLFIENSKLILSALGYRVLEEPLVTNNDKQTTYTYSYNGKKAKGVLSDDGFVLLKGSQLNDESSFAKRWIKKIPAQRNLYKNKIENLVTTEDILFKSSSGAACFCSGQSVSGPKNWVDSDGISLENKIKKNV